MYVDAHCDAARYDPSYDPSDYFGGGEIHDDYVSSTQPGEVSERVAEMVRGAADGLADNFELATLYESTSSEPETDEAEVPPIWQAGIDGLDSTERGVLRNALSVPVHNLGIATVGIVRSLPDSELVKAKGIGLHRATILKALGHHADQETELVLVVGEDMAEQVLKPGALEAPRS